MRQNKFVCNFIGLLTVIFSFALAALADDRPGAVINEIAWMGTESSFNDEWFELYNNSENFVNLEAWKLSAADGTPIINLSGQIPAKGFFLLERSDDATLPSIEADLIYKGSLKNEGEHLKLTDSQGAIIDEVDCSTGWFGGDNATKQTMERKNSSVSGNLAENWQTSQNPGGTPKTQNSHNQETEANEPLPPETTDTEQSTEFPGDGPPETLKGYPRNIFINEVLPSPEGADAENEWLELYNGNDFEVDLSDWQLKDEQGAVKIYTFPENIEIKAKGYLLLNRSQIKITLQNDSEGLLLLNPRKEVAYRVSYEKAPKGQSYNRFSDGWAWSATLTPGKENIISLPENPNQESKKAEADEVKKGTSASEETTLAKIGESSVSPSNQLAVFLIALTIAVFSAIIVLFLKKKFQNEE